MAFLTVDGVDLLVTDINELEPEMIGDETRSDSGQLRGAIQHEKRRWNVHLLEMTEAELAALRGSLAYGSHVAVTGDFISGATLVMRGYLREMPYIYEGTGFLREGRLELVEV